MSLQDDDSDDNSTWLAFRRLFPRPKNYKCELCDKAYAKSGSRSDHMRKIHGVTRDEINLRVCRFCKTLFPNRQDKLSHEDVCVEKMKLKKYQKKSKK